MLGEPQRDDAPLIQRQRVDQPEQAAARLEVVILRAGDCGTGPAGISRSRAQRSARSAMAFAAIRISHPANGTPRHSKRGRLRSARWNTSDVRSRASSRSGTRRATYA
jgi:hypothetical protein